MTPREQALIAINEALRALDFIPDEVDLPEWEIGEDPLDEVRHALANVRAYLDAKSWPAIPAPNPDSDEYAAWFELRAISQRREGLL